MGSMPRGADAASRGWYLSSQMECWVSGVFFCIAGHGGKGVGWGVAGRPPSCFYSLPHVSAILMLPSTSQHTIQQAQRENSCLGSFLGSCLCCKTSKQKEPLQSTTLWAKAASPPEAKSKGSHDMKGKEQASEKKTTPRQIGKSDMYSGLVPLLH